MFAVVTLGKVGIFNRPVVKKFTNYHHITVSKHTKARRLKRLLSFYGDEFVLEKGLNLKGIVSFNALPYYEQLLFEHFRRYVLSTNCHDIRIGICDRKGLFLDRIIDIVNRAENVVIQTDCNADEFCDECLRQCGICPDIVSNKKWLSDCDLIFYPDGLDSRGMVFGKGGFSVLSDRLVLPKEFDCLLKTHVDKIVLAALLSLENEDFLPYRLKLPITPNIYEKDFVYTEPII